MGVHAASTVSSLTSGVKITVGNGGSSLRPMMWMFLAILVTFLTARTVTRLIRSGSGARAGLGNVQIAGNHIHHQVFGILIIIGTGIILVSEMPKGAALDAAAAARPPRRVGVTAPPGAALSERLVSAQGKRFAGACGSITLVCP